MGVLKGELGFGWKSNEVALGIIGEVLVMVEWKAGCGERILVSLCCYRLRIILVLERVIRSHKSCNRILCTVMWVSLQRDREP